MLPGRTSHVSQSLGGLGGRGAKCSGLPLRLPRTAPLPLPHTTHAPQRGRGSRYGAGLRAEVSGRLDVHEGSSPESVGNSEDVLGDFLGDLIAGAGDSLKPLKGADTPIGIAPLGRMLKEDISMMSSAEVTGFCANCGARQPGIKESCAACGHHLSSTQELLGSWERGGWAELIPGIESAEGGAAVAVSLDDRMLKHRSGLFPHYERPERLIAIAHRLASTGLLTKCHGVTSRCATEEELEAVHSKDMIAALTAASHRLHSSLDSDEVEIDVRQYLGADTLLGPHTLNTASLSAGCAAEVAVSVVEGKARAGMAFVRPPGHHACRDYAHNGSIFNNAAVAVRAAQKAGAAKVLLLDWDVHHGKGTQDIFYGDDSVLVISLHRCDDEFHGFGEQGRVEETGDGDAAGFNINIGWTSGEAGDADYMSAMMQVVLPVGHMFRPDLVVIAGGFDAAKNDIIGGCSVSPACFGQMTHMVKALAPTVIVLEGGYNLDATARSVESCLRVLLGESPAALPGEWRPSQAGVVATMNGMQLHETYWPSVRAFSLKGWMTAVKAYQQSDDAESDEGEAMDYDMDSQ